MRYQLQDSHMRGSCVDSRRDDPRVDQPEAEVSEGFHIRIFEDFSDVWGFSEKPGFPIRIIPIIVLFEDQLKSKFGVTHRGPRSLPINTVWA